MPTKKYLKSYFPATMRFFGEKNNNKKRKLPQVWVKNKESLEINL